jgi:hypothetical protein
VAGAASVGDVTMYENAPVETLRIGINRAETVAVFLSSPAGHELKRVLIEVANRWLSEVRKGNPNAFVALNAIDDIASAFDMTITLGEAMLAELVRRQGGLDEDDNESNRVVKARVAL